MIEKMTIIADDGLVSVNGEIFTGLDITALPANIHAVQWYGTRGEVEFKTDAEGNKRHNAAIDSLDAFESIIAIWAAAKKLSETPPPAPTNAELAEQMPGHVNAYLDSVAQSRGYDDTQSICTYGDTGDARYDAEANAFKAWRNAVWQAFYALQDEVLADKRDVMTQEELIDALPKIVWPA